MPPSLFGSRTAGSGLAAWNPNTPRNENLLANQNGTAHTIHNGRVYEWNRGTHQMVPTAVTNAESLKLGTDGIAYVRKNNGDLEGLTDRPYQAPAPASDTASIVSNDQTPATKPQGPFVGQIPSDARDFAVQSAERAYYVDNGGKLFSLDRSGTTENVGDTIGLPTQTPLKSVAVDRNDRLWLLDDSDQLWRKGPADSGGWEQHKQPAINAGDKIQGLRVLGDGLPAVDMKTQTGELQTQRPWVKNNVHTPDWSEVPFRYETRRPIDSAFMQNRIPRTTVNAGVSLFNATTQRRDSKPIADMWHGGKSHFIRNPRGKYSESHRHVVPDLRKGIEQDVAALRQANTQLAPEHRQTLRNSNLGAAVQDRTAQSLDRISRALGLVAPGGGENPGYQQGKEFKKYSGVGAGRVRSDNNALYLAQSRYNSALGADANDPVNRSFNSLLDKGVYIPTGSEEILLGKNGLPKTIKNTLEVPMGTILRGANILQRAGQGLGSINPGPESADTTRELLNSEASTFANHGLNQWADVNFNDLRQLKRQLALFDRYAGMANNPNDPMMRVLSQSGGMQGDPVENYVSVANGDMMLAEHLRLSKNTTLGIGTGAISSLFSLAPSGVLAVPEVSLARTKGAMLEFERRGPGQEVKFIGDSRTGGSLGADVYVGVESGKYGNFSSFVGGQVGVSGKVSRNHRFEGTSLFHDTGTNSNTGNPSRVNPGVERIGQLMQDKNADPLKFLNSAQLNENGRKNTTDASVNPRVGAGLFLTVDGPSYPDGQAQAIVGAGVTAQADFLHYRATDGHEVGPKGVEERYSGRQFDPTAGAGLNAGVFGAGRNVHIAPAETGFHRTAAGLDIGVGHQFDRFAGGGPQTGILNNVPLPREEQKFNHEGVFWKDFKEWVVQDVSDLKKPEKFPHIAELSAALPGFEQTLDKLIANGDPIVFDTALSDEAKDKIANYNPQTDGEYGEFARRIAKDPKNHYIDVFAQYGLKSRQDSAGFNMGVMYNDKAQYAQLVLPGWVFFHYPQGTGADAPKLPSGMPKPASFSLSGNAFNGHEVAEPDYGRLQERFGNLDSARLSREQLSANFALVPDGRSLALDGQEADQRIALQNGRLVYRPGAEPAAYQNLTMGADPSAFVNQVMDQSTDFVPLPQEMVRQLADTDRKSEGLGPLLQAMHAGRSGALPQEYTAQLSNGDFNKLQNLAQDPNTSRIPVQLAAGLVDPLNTHTTSPNGLENAVSVRELMSNLAAKPGAANQLTPAQEYILGEFFPNADGALDRDALDRAVGNPERLAEVDSYLARLQAPQGPFNDNEVKYHVDRLRDNPNLNLTDLPPETQTLLNRHFGDSPQTYGPTNLDNVIHNAESYNQFVNDMEKPQPDISPLGNRNTHSWRVSGLTAAAGVGNVALGGAEINRAVQGLQSDDPAVKEASVQALGLVGGAMSADAISAGAGLVDQHVTRQITRAIDAGADAGTAGVKGLAHLSKGMRALGTVATGATTLLDAYGAFDSFAKGFHTDDTADKINHFVNSGLSTAGIGIGIGTGVGLATGSALGPIGLGVGLVLAGIQQGVNAAHQVDELEEYADLDTGEIWDTGWHLFWGNKPADPIQQEYATNFSQVAADQELAQFGKDMLNDNPNLGMVVLGRGTAGYQHHDSGEYTPHWENRFNGTVDLRAGEGFDAAQLDGNYEDRYEGHDQRWASIHSDEQVMVAQHPELGPDDRVLIDTGEGDQTVYGREDNPNDFIVRAGKKEFIGGNQDDTFNIMGMRGDSGRLDGGEGEDTLNLSQIEEHGESTTGYTVDLEAGHMNRTLTDEDDRSREDHRYDLDNIEHAVGHGDMADTLIGTEGNNRLDGQGGGDTYHGGGGDDLMIVRPGDEAHGGQGNDVYNIIADMESERIDIHEERSDSDENLVVLDHELDAVHASELEESGPYSHDLVTTYGEGEAAVDVAYEDYYGETTDGQQFRKNTMNRLTDDGFMLIEAGERLIDSPESHTDEAMAVYLPEADGRSLHGNLHLDKENGEVSIGESGDDDRRSVDVPAHVEVALIGSHNDDVIRGDDGDDYIEGGGGNDELVGRGGNNGYGVTLYDTNREVYEARRDKDEALASEGVITQDEDADEPHWAVPDDYEFENATQTTVIDNSGANQGHLNMGGVNRDDIQFERDGDALIISPDRAAFEEREKQAYIEEQQEA
ncbi:hypothetical protein FKG94_22660, partial [Exilibacterium tricleocarpae]